MKSHKFIPFTILSVIVGILIGNFSDYFSGKTFSFTHNYSYPVVHYGYFEIYMFMFGVGMLFYVLSIGIPIFKTSIKNLVISAVSGLIFYFFYTRVLMPFYPLITFDAKGYYYYTMFGEIVVTLIFIGMLSPIFYGLYKLKGISHSQHP